MNDMVSIITPAYNAEKYLAQTVQSVLAQEWQNWELLIVDNASTDSTQEVASSFHDSRIRVLREEKKGVGNARNRALAEMRGSFILPLDADDVLPTRSISSRLPLLLENEEVEFVSGVVECMSEDLAKVIERRIPNFTGNPLLSVASLDPDCLPGSSWLIKKRKEKKYEYQPWTHCEDIAFYLSICHTGQYKYVNECVYRLRRGHASAITNLQGLENGFEHLWFYIASLNRLPEGHAERMRKKIRSIMTKTYLKEMQPGNALLIWKKFSSLRQEQIIT